MPFEFDPVKSAINKEKHGIDFVEAQAIWADDKAFRADIRFEDEDRFYAVGQVDGKLWTAVCTMRGNTVRIISVRRSRQDERDIYESQ